VTLAYYNENDKFCAQWLRNLIQQNLIAPGHVDERDIRDVKPYDLIPYTQCHFFAGIGGWSCALRQAGIPDHRKIWTGSCPCQPFSAAGKRLGFADDRHLWPYWRYLIQQRRPAEILGEQVASASQWLGLVRGDLEDLGYAVGAIPVEAASAGADHLRDRYWFVAKCENVGYERSGSARQWRNGSQNSCNDFHGGCGVADVEATIGERENTSRIALGATSFVANDGQRRCNGSGEGQVEFARRTETECAGSASVDVAHAASNGRGESKQSAFYRNGQTPSLADATSSFDMGNACTPRTRWDRSSSTRTQEEVGCERQFNGDFYNASESSGYEWVLGADGKARRVKPGVRLLVDGISGRVAVRRTDKQGTTLNEEAHWYSRVGALKGFGNAIDPRPAAAFIKAALSSI
jgi:site-specific DNA-cytosine methylase